MNIETFDNDQSTKTAFRSHAVIHSDIELNGHNIDTGTHHVAMPMRQRGELLTYEDIPSWYQDNEHIRFGYRPVSKSAYKCFSSLSYLHNESFNIYSHLFPSLVFLAAQGSMFSIISARYPNARVGDYLIFAIFLSSAFITLTVSSAYHLMCNHSQKVYSLWLRLDFAGILLLTAGSFMSGIFLVFFCDRKLQVVYWTITLGLSILTALFVVHPQLQGLRWRTCRLSAFVATGLAGLIPIANGLIIYGWGHMWLASGMPYYVLEGGLLVIGALVYCTRFPEVIWPGRFDIWGSSHNVFHLLVVLATAMHLVGIAQAYDWNYHNSTCRA